MTQEHWPQDTPFWAIELLDELGITPDKTVSFVEVVHRQAEVLFTRRLLDEQPPDVWQTFAQAQEAPMWMRSAIVDYSAAESRWAQVRIRAELDHLSEVLENMMSMDIKSDVVAAQNGAAQE